MPKQIKKLTGFAAVLARFAREPVLLGGATLSTIDAAFPHLSTGWKVAITSWVTVVQRAFSSPKAAVEEAHAQGYNAAVTDISALAPPPTAPTDLAA